MTIRSIGKLAKYRDDLGHAAATGTAPPASTVADTLAAAVPSDVAAAYTSLTGLVAGIVGTSHGYLAARWWIYGGAALFTAVAVFISYRAAASDPAKQRRPWSIPWPEEITALVAFGAWGLIVPQSPFYVFMKAPLLPIVIGALSIGGTFLVTSVLKPILEQPAAPQGAPATVAPPPPVVGAVAPVVGAPAPAVPAPDVAPPAVVPPDDGVPQLDIPIAGV